MAKADGSYIRELSKIENHDLQIIDDFGLQAINNEKQMILMDLVEDRNQRKATIFCSQLPVKTGMISLKKRQSQMPFWIGLSTRQFVLNSRENP